MFIKPAVKENQDSGRPKGGLFIAVPENLKERFCDVSPTNWRVQAVLFYSGTETYLIINIYFPTDPMTIQMDGDELDIALAAIQSVIEVNSFTSLIIAGDANTEFSRRTGHVRTVSSFIEDLGLKVSWNSFVVDFTHMNMINDVTHTRVLDHFFYSDSLSVNLVDAGVIHLVENESDHCPIFFIFNVELKEDREKSQETKFKMKPCWKKATKVDKESYVESLLQKLNHIQVPVVNTCRDAKCNNSNHRIECDDYVEEVLKAVEDSAKKTLPCREKENKNASIKRNIPGWNEEIKPFKDEARFWHSVWLSAGKPINTELHKIMKRTKKFIPLSAEEDS